MSKPEWKTAPDWAKWLAQDSDGCWSWYSEKPLLLPGKTAWIAQTGGFSKWVRNTECLKPFAETLESRPC